MDAAKKMVRSGFPAVPAIDSLGRSIGLVTQGDLVRHLAGGSNLETTTVGDISTESYTLTLDDTIEDAANLIGSAAVSVLPVVDGGRLVGVLTSVDIAAQRRLQAALGADAANLVTEISPSDSMHAGSRGSYVIAGVSALQCVRQAMKFVDKSRPTNILDFPCGYGRVLRILKAAFPDAQLTACDLDRDGVDFCARVLGAIGIYSHSDPAEVGLDGGYDLIWCGSLFTHLKASRWPGFLDLFGRMLSPGGLVLLTTHGRHPAHALRTMAVPETGVQQMLEAYDKTGFGYAQMPIDLEEDYGLTIASPEWIRVQIDQQPNLEFIGHAVRAWQPPAPQQDVVTCARPMG